MPCTARLEAAPYPVGSFSPNPVNAMIEDSAAVKSGSDTQTPAVTTPPPAKAPAKEPRRDAPPRWPLLAGGIGVMLFGVAALLWSAAAVGILPSSSTSMRLQLSTPDLVTSATSDFELVQLGTMRRDQFLVNRRSGRVWQSVCSGAVRGAECDGMMIWDEMYVDGVTPQNNAAAVLYRMGLQGRLEE